jgi:MoaA/NifB/PqqE/SkfB family radical SAM enzyme
MSLKTFERIIDDVCENRPLIKLYLSGEPLLHENLFEMIACAAAADCQTVIHTNATLLTREVSEQVLSSPLTFLSFSFDGCSPQDYEQVRPPAHFGEVESNIRQYLDLRRANQGRGPRTAIEIIRMRQTEDLLQDFVEHWRTSGVDDVRVVEHMTWHGLVEDRRVENACDRSGYKPCAAPFQHGCILSDGTVVPCCLDVDGTIPLGNVTEQGFREVWTGNDYRRLRLAMLTATLPPGCICDRCDNTFRRM